MSQQPTSYTQAEVNAILKRALARQENAKLLDDGLSHDELVETAREVGIPEERLQTAIAEMKREREALSLRDEWLTQRRAGLRSNGLTWAFVSALCFAIAWLTHGGEWWLWVLVPWGLVVALQTARLVLGPSPAALDRLARRRERKLRRAQRRAQVDRTIGAVGDAVEKGARLLAEALDARRRPLDDPNRRR